MHVWEQVSDVLLRLQNVSQHNVLDTEIVGWINSAFSDLGNILYDIDRQWFTTTGTIDTTVGNGTYNLPDDVLQVECVDVDLAGTASGDLSKFYRAHQYAMRDIASIYGPQALSQLAPSGGAPLATRPACVIVGTQLKVYPLPTVAVTGGIRIIYTRKPNLLTLAKRAVNVSTTSAGAADGSTLVSTALSSPNRNDFWKECMISINSGTSQYERKIVQSFTTSSGTCTMRNSFATQIANGVTFDINDHSIIPEQFHSIAQFYATGMAALKAKSPELAGEMLKAYDSRMDRLYKSREDVKDVKAFDSAPVSRENRS